MSKNRTVLVTGFEPFGGDAINPSEQVARALHGRELGGRPVVGAVLPCVFSTARPELVRLLRTYAPSLVICLGLAGGRAAITPERVAINVIDARIPDNAGDQPVDAPVIRSGPAAYWSRLPTKAIVAALQAKRIPAAVSASAGTFVCNHVFYALMHALRWQRQMRGGFIHLPYASEMAPAGQPSLPLATLIDGIALAIETTLATRRDARLPGGVTS
jgi:pyroglutamyl-peptidase